MAKMVEIKNNMARLFMIGAGKEHGKINLMPGNNMVDANDWKAAKSLKVVAHYLDSRDLEETVVADDDNLAQLSVGAAANRVLECLDSMRLKSWLTEENRPAVRKAIEDQLAKINSRRRVTEKSE